MTVLRPHATPPYHDGVYQPQFVGLAIAIVGVISFASVTTLARTAYENGGHPLVVLAVRTLAVVAATWLAAKANGISLRLPRRAWPLCGLLSVGVFGLSGALYAALIFISVGLATSIFYVFPFIISGYLAFQTRSKLSLSECVCMTGAILGLSIMLLGSMGDIYWVGVIFSMIAACAAALAFLTSSYLFRDHGILACMFWSNIGCMFLIFLMLAATGNIELESLTAITGPGWLSITFICGIFIIAIFSQSLSIWTNGPTYTAVIFCFEPAIAMILGKLLLDQDFAAYQSIGLSLIVISLISYARRHGSH